jgi:hypothetical protein
VCVCVLHFNMITHILEMFDRLTDLPFDQIIHYLSIDDYVRTSLISREIKKRLFQYRKMKTPYICLLEWTGHGCEEIYRFITEQSLTSRCKESLQNLDPEIFTEKKHSLHRNHDLINYALEHGYDQFTNHVILCAVPWEFRKGFDPAMHEMCCMLNVSMYVNAKLIKYSEKTEKIVDDAARKEMRARLFQKLCEKRQSIGQWIGGWDDYYPELNRLLNGKLMKEH